MIQHGLVFGDAVQKFTLLSIGDGLVSQIPGLIVSLAAGVLVTRTSGNSDNLGDQIGGQLSAYPKAMGLLALMLVGVGFIPGMPKMPFMMVAGVFAALMFSLRKAEKVKEREKAVKLEDERRSEIESGSSGEQDDGKSMPAEFENSSKWTYSLWR